jgi:hypothetical protein
VKGFVFDKFLYFFVFSAISTNATPDSKNSRVRIKISNPASGQRMSPIKPDKKSPWTNRNRPAIMTSAIEIPIKIIEIRYKTLATGRVMKVVKDLSVSDEKKFFIIPP